MIPGLGCRDDRRGTGRDSSPDLLQRLLDKYAWSAPMSGIIRRSECGSSQPFCSHDFDV
jgi:hypothetical protein